MRRPWPIAIAFTLCLAVVLVALAWITSVAMRLDRAEALARHQAALEENVRLALWRMDSALGPLIAQESAMPATAFLAVRQHGLPMGPAVAAAAPPAEWVKLRFQLDARGELASAAARVATKPNQRAEKRQSIVSAVAELRRAVDLPTLWDLAPPNAATESNLSSANHAAINIGAVDLPSDSPPLQPPTGQSPQLAQRTRGISEFQRRSQNTQIANQLANPSLPGADPATVGEAAPLMSPVWRGGQLLLLRQVSLNGAERLQGSWLDWPLVDRWLVSLISDLLPAAALSPIAPGAAEPTRLLAALPVRLEPGQPPPDSAARLSPLHLSLLTAWCCVLLAATAVAVLLSGVVSLSERRAAFVSAVTHELRTPLTTFRMYAEMLAEGMVPEESRRDYLETLRTESGRLGHLVENVLAYARLEHGRTAGRCEPTTAGDLVARLEDRLRSRADAAGMTLIVEMGTDAEQMALSTDTAAVEQILFNLVDNACKYAGGAADRRIHLRVARREGHVAIEVGDHGPGVPPAQARRLFRPFVKSAEQAAQSASGVGLGLALSQRLARRLGGRLTLERQSEFGALFALSLPSR
jgi:signal transduction histidine kinase